MKFEIFSYAVEVRLTNYCAERTSSQYLYFGIPNLLITALTSRGYSSDFLNPLEIFDDYIMQ